MDAPSVASTESASVAIAVYENDSVRASNHRHLPTVYENAHPDKPKDPTMTLYQNTEDDIPEFVPGCTSAHVLQIASLTPPPVAIVSCPPILLDHSVHVTPLDLASLPTSSWVPLCPRALPYKAHILRLRSIGNQGKQCVLFCVLCCSCSC